MQVEREIIQEIVNKYLYDMWDAYDNDYSSWFLAWVQEALRVIAISEWWTESDIKRYFNNIL